MAYDRYLEDTVKVPDLVLQDTFEIAICDNPSIPAVPKALGPIPDQCQIEHIALHDHRNLETLLVLGRTGNLSGTYRSATPS